MKTAYKKGYYARRRDDSISENPYLQKTQPVEHYAWAGGWNDCDLGYALDLTVFED